MLDRMFRLLADTFPLSLPRARLHEEIGPEALEWLERTRSVRSETLVAYPCRRGGWMHLVRTKTGLRAVCSAQVPECEDEAITPADAYQVSVDDDTLVPVLQRAVGIDQTWARWRNLVLLGERRFGRRVVDFALAPCLDDAALEDIDDLVRRDPDRVLVVLVFHRKDLPPAASIEGPRIRWVALSDAHPTPEGLVVDLLDLWDRWAPDEDPGIDLWPRYLFVADPARARFWYKGRKFELKRRPRLRRLLIELLLHPGEVVTSQSLWPLLWPEEYIGDGEVDLDWFQRELQRAKSELSAVLRRALLPVVDDKDPIQNARSPSDTDGGYWVSAHPAQIRWMSPPDADLSDP